MKQVISIILILAIAIAPAFGRKTKPKAGKLENGVYKDNKYDFEVNIPENWEIKIKKAKSDERFSIQQKDPKIPPEMAQYPQMAITPGVGVIVGNVEFTPSAFIDSLFSESYSSKLKSKLRENIDIIEEGVKFNGFSKGKKKALKINGKDAAYWTGIASYTFTMMGKSIQKKVGIGFLGIKNDKDMLIYAWGCEDVYVKEVSDEIIAIGSSTVWK